jgi:signal transduction histidine kinase
VLDISKVEAGQMDVFSERIHIPYLVHELSQTVQPIIKEKNNTFVIDMPEEIGTLIADEVKLQQCLLNLISNAAKFTSNGRITLKLYRKIRNDGLEYIYFETQDTGIGIKTEQIESIFKAFTQADTSTTRKYGGTGLGLTITKSFCQIMGGDISVESEYGKGSCFTIHLPAGNPQEISTVQEA